MVGTSYMIPIVYRYIDSYSPVFLLLYRVPRYLAYLSTWLASVSWRARMPQARQVTEVGQDTKVSQDTQASQVSEVGQDIKVG